MAKYIKIIISALIAPLFISSYILYTKNQSLKKELSISVSNEKAFIAENSSLKDENRVFKFTVEQLNYYSDSILQKMNEVRKELKIKDKDLKKSLSFMEMHLGVHSENLEDLIKEGLARIYGNEIGL